MKKFTKGMLIAAGIFGAVGIGLTAAGGVMGASMSELTGVESLKRVLLVAFQNQHCKHRGSGGNITRTPTHAVGGCHAGSGVSLRRT